MNVKPIVMFVSRLGKARERCPPKKVRSIVSHYRKRKTWTVKICTTSCWDAYRSCYKSNQVVFYPVDLLFVLRLRLMTTSSVKWLSRQKQIQSNGECAFVTSTIQVKVGTLGSSSHKQWSAITIMPNASLSVLFLFDWWNERMKWYVRLPSCNVNIRGQSLFESCQLTSEFKLQTPTFSPGIEIKQQETFFFFFPSLFCFLLYWTLKRYTPTKQPYSILPSISHLPPFNKHLHYESSYSCWR
jgi:hypothetical protein